MTRTSAPCAVVYMALALAECLGHGMQFRAKVASAFESVKRVGGTTFPLASPIHEMIPGYTTYTALSPNARNTHKSEPQAPPTRHRAGETLSLFLYFCLSAPLLHYIFSLSVLFPCSLSPSLPSSPAVPSAAAFCCLRSTSSCSLCCRSQWRKRARRLCHRATGGFRVGGNARSIKTRKTRGNRSAVAHRNRTMGVVPLSHKRLRCYIRQEVLSER